MQFGFPESAIEELRRTGQAVRSFTMRAPADGTVIEKSAMRGMRFQSGEMLFKLIDLSEIWVVANVPEREIGRIAEGQNARIAFNAFPGERFEGKVLLIHPELDMATRTAMVRIGLPNRDGRLKPHLFAEVEIETGGGGDVIAVPQSAIIDSGERQVVIAEREEGLYEPRDVKLGRSNGGFTEIDSGTRNGRSDRHRRQFPHQLRKQFARLAQRPELRREAAMIASIIRWSARNVALVLIGAVFATLAGIYSLSRIPLDAIPDLSDTQVIVYTDYPGQAPQVIEDQVTFP